METEKSPYIEVIVEVAQISVYRADQVVFFEEKIIMKKWYNEEYEWEIEVIGFNKDNEETF